MISAKNYKTVAKFVKIMPRILWPLFSRTRCICACFKYFLMLTFYCVIMMIMMTLALIIMIIFFYSPVW